MARYVHVMCMNDQTKGNDMRPLTINDINHMNHVLLPFDCARWARHYLRDAPVDSFTAYYLDEITDRPMTIHNIRMILVHNPEFTDILLSLRFIRENLN